MEFVKVEVITAGAKLEELKNPLRRSALPE